MKNKHLVLLALFALLGLWFFQKWPFKRQNSIEMPFLECTVGDIQAFSFTPIDSLERFELRRAEDWVLTQGKRSHLADGASVTAFLSKLAILQHGQFISRPNALRPLGRFTFENAKGQRFLRKIFLTAGSDCVVQLIDVQPKAFLRYDAQTILPKLMEIKADSFRNTTIFDFNPTEVIQFSYKNGTDSLLVFDKKMNADSVYYWSGSVADSLRIDSFLLGIMALRQLSFQNDFDAETESVLHEKHFSFLTEKGHTKLICYLRGDSTFCLTSSANPDASFLLRDSFVRYIGF